MPASSQVHHGQSVRIPHARVRVLRTRCEAVILFIRDAVRFGCAYIDLDGTLIYRMRVPPGFQHFADNYEGDALQWWRHNLKPMPIVKSRLALCYLLRLLRVRLVVWTNRWPENEGVTRASLGRHVWLFSELQFHASLKGTKPRLPGPVLEDQEKYLKCGRGNSLLVKQL